MLWGWRRHAQASPFCLRSLSRGRNWPQASDFYCTKMRWRDAVQRSFLRHVKYDTQVEYVLCKDLVVRDVLLRALLSGRPRAVMWLLPHFRQTAPKCLPCYILWHFTGICWCANIDPNCNFTLLLLNTYNNSLHGRIYTVGLCEASKPLIFASNHALLDLIFVSYTDSTRKSRNISRVRGLFWWVN